MSCPACFSGHEASATPTGAVETVHGLSTYVSRSPSDNGSSPPRGAVVVIPDAYGWELVNNRLLADNLARKGGFDVYLPDFMNGPGAPKSLLPDMRALRADSSGIWGFFKRAWAILKIIPRVVPFMLRNRPSKTYPRVRTFMAAFAEASPMVPLFAAGYCWGGKHVFLLAGDSSSSSSSSSPSSSLPAPIPTLKALYTGHPSMLVLPADASAVRIPLSVAVGTRDDALGPDKIAVLKSTLDGVSGGAHGPATEIVVYDGAAHGFCIRLDREDEEELRHAGEAEDQAVRWFKRFSDI